MSVVRARLTTLTIVALIVSSVATLALPGRSPALAAHNVVHGKVFVIDPGHGTPCPAGETGTTGPWSGQTELSQVWEVAHSAKNYLESLGAIVYLTKQQVNDCPSVQQRADFVNSRRPSAFVSIHRNGDNNPAVRGIQTFYGFSNLSIYVQNALVAELGWPNNGTTTRCATVALPCLVSPTPSALAEIGYMTNQTEDLGHDTWAEWQKSGLGVANGIYNFCLYNGC